MLHFRAVILMSLNKDLYSYHHKKFEAISFFKFVKKDKTNSLIYMYIYQQNKGHYINIFKRITLQFRAVILMSLNKNLYSYHHKKFEAITFFKVCKKDKTNSLIYMYIYYQNKAHYIKIFKRIMLQFRAVILMSHNKNLYSYHQKKFEVISFFKVCKKDKMNSLIYMYIYQQNKGHYINIFKKITQHFRAVILMSLNKDLYSYHHKKIQDIS